MTGSRLGTFEDAGVADPGRALRAAGLDFAAALVVAMLLWPFPLVRLTLGVPWVVHVPLIVVWVLLVFAAYLAASVSLWGRTPAMYLLDLGLAGAPRPFGRRAVAAWAGASTLAILPAFAGARGLADPRDGLPARISGLVTVATGADT